jgi:multiple sugar transport system permease protein
MALEALRRPRQPRAGTGRLARHEERVAYAFLSPWLAGLLFLLAVPLVYAIWISVTDAFYLRPGRAEFVGAENYVEIFTDDRDFRQALNVTFRWILMTTPLFLISGLLLSLLLNQRVRGMNLFRTILYIPAVLSGVAVTILWLSLFNETGAVNSLLRGIGIEDPPQWFRHPDWAMPGLAIMGLWGVGGSAIIFLAGLQNIPPHLYEAASIDGAGALAKFRHITLPMLSPTLFFLAVNAVIDALLVFAQVWIVSSGSTRNAGPADSLLFYMYYVYIEGFRNGNYGYASALAWILTIIGVLLVWFVFRFEKRFVYYEARA